MFGKINQAVKILRQGGIIVYPTEGVYGLGCDPFNETAVLRLLKIKHRSMNKGLILIAANWWQVEDLVKADLKQYAVVKKNREPITLVFPTTKKTPCWITGKFSTVAIRITSHPVAKKICQKFGGPIISTSANVAGKRPITKLSLVDKSIMNNIDLVVSGVLGKLGKPTKICDVVTGKVFRA